MEIDMIDIFEMIVPFWYAFVYLCGMAFAVYALCVLYKMIKEVNIACEGDGKKTTELGVLFLLNYVTLGVYSYIWWYKFGNRLAKNAPRYGLEFKKLGRTMLALKISQVFVILLSCARLIFLSSFSSEDLGLLASFQIVFLMYLTMATCIVGLAVFHFILMGIALKYTNRICAGYNAAHGL